MQNDSSQPSLLNLINKNDFDALAKKYQIDKWIRTFSTWEMTQVLIASFIQRTESFREIESTFGVSDSTLGDALRVRDPRFFQDLCDMILLEIRAKTNDRQTKKAIRMLLAIDSTDIKVHGSLFNVEGWKIRRSGEAHKASAKLHLVWNVNDEWIDDFIITPGRKNDSPVSLNLRLRSGAMYIFDRAYNDNDMWVNIVAAGSHFVTRLKDYPRYKMALMKILQTSGDSVGVLHDGMFTNIDPTYPSYRLVIFKDPQTQKVFLFVTSDFTISPLEVAEIYKKRWAVELLFRWLKGHLNIRRLPTKNNNAIQIQLAVAVLVQLLLQLRKILTNYQGTLWTLLRKIRSAIAQIGIRACMPPPGCRWGKSAIHSRMLT